jgi:hypothetical protein
MNKDLKMILKTLISFKITFVNRKSQLLDNQLNLI